MAQTAKKETLLLCGILLVAVSLRFHALGVPSMWNDEIVVATTADHPVSYIVERALGGIDTHPPYYHILVKWMLSLGRSDFALRLHSAILGVVSVFGIFVLGRRLFSAPVGLIAAAILSIVPLHIMLSRELRPYSMLLLLSMAALYGIFNYLNTRQRKWLVVALVSDVLLCPLQFMTVLIIGAQSCVLLFAYLNKPRLVRLKDVVLFSTLALLTYLPSALFIFHSQFSDSMSGNRLSVILNYARSLTRNLFPSDNLGFLALLVAGLGLTVLSCRKDERSTINALLVYIFIPVLPLFLVKYNSYFNPWHIVFVMPPLILIVSRGIQLALSKAKMLAYAAAIAYGCIVVSIFYNGTYYQVKSYGGHFKQIAASLSPDDVPAGLPLPTDFGKIYGANWYAEQSGTRLFEHYFKQRKPTVDTISFIVFDDYGHYAASEEEFLSKYGKDAAVQSFSWGSVYSLPVKPAPDRFHAFPLQTVLTAEPAGFFSRVVNVSNLTMYPFFGFKAIPYLDGVIARFDYPMVMPSTTEPVFYKITLHCSHDFAGTDAIDVSYAINDGRFVPVHFPEKPGQSVKTLLLRAAAPVDKLLLRCELQRHSQAPAYNSTRIDAVGIDNITVYANSIANERFVSPTLDLTESGIGEIESCPEGTYRWGYGPASVLKFVSPSEQPVTLEYRFNNPIEGQRVAFSHNGKIVAAHDNLPAERWLAGTTTGTVTVNAVKGENEIVVSYGKWNADPHDPAATFAPRDGRPMAVAFTKLLINTAQRNADAYLLAY